MRLIVCECDMGLLGQGLKSQLSEDQVHILSLKKQLTQEKLGEPDLAVVFAHSTYEYLSNSRFAGSHIPTLLISVGWNEDMDALHRAKLSAYLGVDYNDTSIAAALNVISGGGKYIHPGSSRLPPIPSLTDRQRDILIGLAHGMTDEEMSQLLQITCATVRHHLDGLQERLRVHRRSHLIGWGCLGGFQNIPLPHPPSKEAAKAMKIKNEIFIGM